MTVEARSVASEIDVHAAVASVHDPEYPGISIVDLGLLESIAIQATAAGAQVQIGLIPTFSGCPALDMIASDVHGAVAAMSGVAKVDVTWLSNPAWSIDRVSVDARAIMASEFTVAVELGRTPVPSATCPLCGAPTQEQSMFGPSRCRAVHRCTGCNETVEVLRG